MPADLYLQFLPPTAGVAAALNGPPVDLCKGTDAQKYNSNAPNLLAGKDTRLLALRINVANAGGTTPSMTAQYQESDGDGNAVPASGTFVNNGGSVTITGNGEYFLPFSPDEAVGAAPAFRLLRRGRDFRRAFRGRRQADLPVASRGRRGRA